VIGPVWIGEAEVLALHDRLLALDGGVVGVRDAGLLASALARPRHLRTYADEPAIIEMAPPRRLESSAITLCRWK
jgi:death on curing protein